LNPSRAALNSGSNLSKRDLHSINDMDYTFTGVQDCVFYVETP